MGLFRKSSYQKECEMKIKELCGGFLFNDEFKKRAEKYKSVDGLSNSFEKSILKHECEEGTLLYEDIEDRLDELLQLDAETLDLKIRLRQKQDTSKFRNQEDINRFMGREYAEKYRLKCDAKYEKTEKRKEKAFEEYNFFEGVTVFASFSLKDMHLDEFKTLMQLKKEGIFFTRPENLLIPYNHIDDVKKDDSGYIALYIIDNQQIRFKFDIAGIWSYDETKRQVENNFFYFLEDMGSEFNNGQTSGMFCPECGVEIAENHNFCQACGRKLK